MKRLSTTLVIALALTFILTLGYAGLTSTAAFGPYTDTWEGTEEFRTIAGEDNRELHIASQSAHYERVDPNETVAILFPAREPYSTEHVSQLELFLEAGGTLVIADARAEPTNSLLDALGASTSIDGDPLRDERHYRESPALPETQVITNHSVTTGADTFILNYGSVLETDAEPLINSSRYSYLDRDHSGDLSPDESLASYPIATNESMGNGDLIVFSDASPFIDAMLDYDDNRVIATNLVAPYESVMLDTTHTERLPPLAALLMAIRNSSLLQSLFAFGAVVAIWAGTRRGPTLLTALETRLFPSPPRTSSPPTEEITHVISRHRPAWDEARIERIAETIRKYRR